jgi:hypothetical protein
VKYDLETKIQTRKTQIEDHSTNWSAVHMKSMQDVFTEATRFFRISSIGFARSPRMSSSSVLCPKSSFDPKSKSPGVLDLEPAGEPKRSLVDDESSRSKPSGSEVWLGRLGVGAAGASLGASASKFSQSSSSPPDVLVEDSGGDRCVEMSAKVGDERPGAGLGFGAARCGTSAGDTFREVTEWMFCRGAFKVQNTSPLEVDGDGLTPGLVLRPGGGRVVAAEAGRSAGVEIGDTALLLVAELVPLSAPSS